MRPDGEIPDHGHTGTKAAARTTVGNETATS